MDNITDDLGYHMALHDVVRAICDYTADGIIDGLKDYYPEVYELLLIKIPKSSEEE